MGRCAYFSPLRLFCTAARERVCDLIRIAGRLSGPQARFRARGEWRIFRFHEKDDGECEKYHNVIGTSALGS
jgi:hypothetical protein